MKPTWHKINNHNEFIEHSRKLIFKFFGETNENVTADELSEIIFSLTAEEQIEMDNILSLEECESISKQYILKKINKKTKKINYYITDLALQEMLESFNSRLVSNILNQLVNKGLLQTGFDEKSNDFIFWVTEDENKEKDLPETD